MVLRNEDTKLKLCFYKSFLTFITVSTKDTSYSILMDFTVYASQMNRMKVKCIYDFYSVSLHLFLGASINHIISPEREEGF